MLKFNLQNKEELHLDSLVDLHQT